MGKKNTEVKEKRQKQKIKCSICMERQAKASIQCSHRFCTVCIKRWAKKRLTCPLCRKSFFKITSGSREYTFENPSIAPKPPTNTMVFQPLIVSWSYVYLLKLMLPYQNNYPVAPAFMPSFYSLN